MTSGRESLTLLTLPHCGASVRSIAGQVPTGPEARDPVVRQRRHRGGAGARGLDEVAARAGAQYDGG